ncbi:MAG: tRNA threonylcarbamoyladenosine dehydratase [Clostridiales bacterium]|nr:tRNA threonylcarbamoyladenosine dehydratase [Clostridiales bacterium]
MDERTLRARMLLGQKAMDKLRESHVAVFGLGGVGSWCAEALARSGVGRLTLIDQDTVGESNINRQLCALGSTLGMAKAEVMAARIRDISPDIRLRCIEGHYEAADRDRFFDGYDYVVDAIDLVSCKVDLIMSCMERGIPVVSALGTGNKRDASQLRIDDISRTSGCALARVVRRELRQRGVTHHQVVFSPEEAMEPEQLEAPPPGRRSVPGSLVWVPATAGLLLCQHVVTQLCAQAETTENAPEHY